MKLERNFALHGASRAALAALAVALLAVSAGQARPPAPPKTFTLVYCWGATSADDIDPLYCPSATLTLYGNKTFDAYDDATGDSVSNAGTWSTGRRPKSITFTITNGPVYSGTYNSQTGTYVGTITWPGYGVYGYWEGAYVP